MGQEWTNMITILNRNDKKKFFSIMAILGILLMLSSLGSIMAGQYEMGIVDTLKAILNIFFDRQYDVNPNAEKVIMLIRFPRTITAFIVGSCLAVSGSVFQSTFNNKLVSPDVLGVSAGACVGAAISILYGVSSYFVGVFAFFSGLIAVSITLALPKLFKSNKTVTLVLAGIIVSSLMNSLIGILKFLADKDDKLGEITFWIMGSLAGITFKEIATVLPIFSISVIGVFLLRWKINIISLGEYEAKNLGENFLLLRFLIIILATSLTAVSVSLSGNVGWIGLVVPHISRGLVGGDNRYAIPVSFLFGGTFMIIVDVISRNFSVDEIPLSIITGLIGTIIYTVVLIRKGRELND